VQRKEHLKAIKTRSGTSRKAGDYGKVAEIRYGKITEAENNLKDLQVKMKAMQGEHSF
jgi:ATP-dependent Clp protease ATP-binding subunit ClpB